MNFSDILFFVFGTYMPESTPDNFLRLFIFLLLFESVMMLASTIFKGARYL